MCQSSDLPEGHAILEAGHPMFRPPDKYRKLAQIRPHIRKAVRELAAGEMPWPLFVYGDVGSGKTCVGLCAMDVFGGWYLTVGELCDLLIAAQRDRLAWSSGHRRTIADVWQGWGRANLTVLDELGSRQTVSDHHYEAVKRAIDIREGRPALFISNHTLDELSRIYDRRISSRLVCGTRLEAEGERRIERALKLVGT